MSRELLKKTELRSFFLRLRQVMDELDWNQSALAREAKISTMTLSRWASGKHPPRLPAINKITTVTGCRMEWLLYGAGEMWDPDVPSPHRSGASYLDRIVVEVEEYIISRSLNVPLEKKAAAISFLNEIATQLGFDKKHVATIITLAAQ